VRYPNATPHIAEYQRVSPFLGQGTQHRKAGEGGKLPVEHARILKNGAVTIGVCSAAGRPWDTDRPSWPRAVEGGEWPSAADVFKIGAATI
jgi:hypothetical protein